MSIIFDDGGDYMIKNKKIVGSIIVLLIFAVFVISGYYLTKPGESDVMVINESKTADKSIGNKSTDSIDTKNLKKEIKAQIFGEVNKPGVYTLKSGDRVKDLIDTAGGFTGKADYYSVNGAKKLIDGDNIEIKSKNSNNSGVKTSSSAAKNSAVASDAAEKLDINSATEEDIINKKIPGIGKGLAGKIVQYRESNEGRINSQKDLVSAIGPKRAEKLMNYIELN